MLEKIKTLLGGKKPTSPRYNEVQICEVVRKYLPIYLKRKNLTFISFNDLIDFLSYSSPIPAHEWEKVWNYFNWRSPVYQLHQADVLPILAHLVFYQDFKPMYILECPKCSYRENPTEENVTGNREIVYCSGCSKSFMPTDMDNYAVYQLKNS